MVQRQHDDRQVGMIHRRRSLPSQAYYDYAALLRRHRADDYQPVEVRREGWDRFSAGFPPDERVVCEPVNLDGVAAEWVRWPELSTTRTILYFHGGGYCTGSAHGHRRLVSEIGRAGGAQALSVDYRLAPEAPFPAALDDALAAYTWLVDLVGADQIIVAGDSAGAGLALALLLAVNSGSGPDEIGHLELPLGAVCLSPSTDLAKSGGSHRANAEVDPIMHAERSAELARWYAGSDDLLTHPLVSPLYGDHAGLPPMLVLTGTWELLHDDATALAERAASAGVEVQLEEWQDMMHIWPYFLGKFPEAAEAVACIGDFIHALFDSSQQDPAQQDSDHMETS